MIFSEPGTPTETGDVRPPMAPCWAIGTVGPGSSGATTLAVALATHAGGVLVEADSDGGVLGARYGCWLNEGAPSLASLLAALHVQVAALSIRDHAQRLPGGTPVVLVAPCVEGAIGPVTRLAYDLPQVRAGFAGEPMILDVGRIRSDGPGLSLASQADALVVVTQPKVESLGCLLARLPFLLERIPRLVVAVRGDGPYSLAEIRGEVELRYGNRMLIVAIPEDRLGVAALAQPAQPERRVKVGRSSGSLMRSVDALLRALPGSATVVGASVGATP